MKKQRKVIHLEINGEHHYFGSLKALCDHFGPDQLGMSYPSVRNLGISPENPYTHPRHHYTIREGVLVVAMSLEEEE